MTFWMHRFFVPCFFFFCFVAPLSAQLRGALFSSLRAEVDLYWRDIHAAHGTLSVVWHADGTYDVAIEAESQGSLRFFSGWTTRVEADGTIMDGTISDGASSGASASEVRVLPATMRARGAWRFGDFETLLQFDERGPMAWSLSRDDFSGTRDATNAEVLAGTLDFVSAFMELLLRVNLSGGQCDYQTWLFSGRKVYAMEIRSGGLVELDATEFDLPGPDAASPAGSDAMAPEAAPEAADAEADAPGEAEPRRSFLRCDAHEWQVFDTQKAAEDQVPPEAEFSDEDEEPMTFYLQKTAAAPELWLPVRAAHERAVLYITKLEVSLASLPADSR